MRGPRRLTVPLFLAASFLGAALLFWIEPLFTKGVLPLLGGSPGVWNTALFFFQGTLLAGYAYVHLGTRLSPRVQIGLHTVLLVCAVGFFLPPPAHPEWVPPLEALPVPWLLGRFTVAIGVPFLALAATAPLLQRWLASTDNEEARDPYFLYAASNAGSMTALLAFPLLLEPWLGLSTQAALWSAAFGAFAVLVVLAGLVTMRRRATADPSPPAPVPAGRDPEAPRPAPAEPRPPAGGSEGARGGSASTPPRSLDRLRWVLLTFVPSSLLLGVTAHISTDVAAFPLLWIVPLALYLATFVWAFARRPAVPLRRVLTLEALLVIPLSLTLAGRWPLALGIPLHLGTFFVIALACHAALARSRPPAGWLTEFYLWIAVGGMLGGLFNALLAPILFDSVLEYPLVLVLACLLRPRQAGARRLERTLGVAALLALAGALAYRAAPLALLPSTAGSVSLLLFLGFAVYAVRRRPIPFAAGVALLMVVSPMLLGPDFPLLERGRSFYGVYTVRTDPVTGAHLLFHGTTVHGVQATTPELRTEPVAYYSRRGPAGSLFRPETLDDAASVGIVGLGTGALACYGREGQDWTFYEIDPLVVRLARDTRYFHYLSECGEAARITLGDARLSLREERGRAYDLLVLDAFSSDAIPAHLLTREALELYLGRIRPDGLLAFHISNRYMDLEPLLAALLDDLPADGLAATYTPPDSVVGSYDAATHWIVASPSAERLQELRGVDPRWRALRGGGGLRPWTDDYSNPLAVLNW